MTKLNVSEDLLQSVAEEILSDVDYDIYKEDLEEGSISHEIKGHLISFLEDLGFAVVKVGGE